MKKFLSICLLCLSITYCHAGCQWQSVIGHFMLSTCSFTATINGYTTSYVGGPELGPPIDIGSIGPSDLQLCYAYVMLDGGCPGAIIRDEGSFGTKFCDQGYVSSTYKFSYRVGFHWGDNVFSLPGGGGTKIIQYPMDAYCCF